MAKDCPASEDAQNGSQWHTTQREQSGSAAWGNKHQQQKHQQQGGWYGVQAEQVELNRELLRCVTPQEILSLARERLDIFNLVNCSTALQQLGRLHWRGALDLASAQKSGAELEERKAFDSLIERTCEWVNGAPKQAQPRHLSSLLHSLVKLDCVHEVVLFLFSSRLLLRFAALF